MIKNMTIEVCCGSIEDCVNASKFPIDRIELNSALELGGLTCSLGTLVESKRKINLPICCMVRPRTAGFVYTQEQFESMLIDAKLLLEHGADGIVFGFLTPQNEIDLPKTKKMTELIHSYHKEAIFHKAFDATNNKMESCKQLIECKVNRILTSGGENYPHIEQGYDVLRKLIESYNQQIDILVGGGVRDFNIHELIEKTKCTQIHMSAKQEAQDRGTYLEVSPINLQKILNQI